MFTSRATRVLLAITFTLVCAGIVQAAEVTRLDAMAFTRTPGKPNKFVVTFGAVPGAGKVIIRNGEPDGRRKVSNASVRLNGEGLVGPQTLVRDPNQRDYEFTVQLLEQNTLTVELASVPGSFLLISATQEQDPPPPLITGMVRDRVTELPVANARVSFAGSGSGVVFTDVDGRYTFTASDLTLYGGGISGFLWASAPGYFENVMVTVPELTILPYAQDMTLLPGGAVMTGVVQDATTGNGVGGAQLSIYGPFMTTAHVVADANGRYEVDASFFNEAGLSWPPGVAAYMSISVTAEGYLGLTRTRDHLYTYPIVENITLQTIQGPVVMGAVRDRNTGLPVANARVSLGGGMSGTVFTDADGNYVFHGNDVALSCCGAYIPSYLSATGNGYFQAPGLYLPQLTSYPFVQDFTLLPGGVLIQGRVRDAVSGAGIAGSSVFIWGNVNMTPTTVVTDGNGHYAVDSSYFDESILTVISGMTYYVAISPSAEGYLGTTRFRDDFSAVPLVEDFNLLSINGPVLSGLIRDRQTGLPIANAKVTFSGSATGTVFTDANGLYTFRGTDLTLSEGAGGTAALRGAVFAKAPGFFQNLASPLLDFNAGPLVHDMTLLPGGTVITGVVRDQSTGVAIAGAHVTAGGIFMTGIADVVTDVNGVYEIDSYFFSEEILSVVPGTAPPLPISVSAPGYLDTTQLHEILTTFPQREDFGLVPTQ